MVSSIIIAHYYQIGTAATNRIIAYAKSFSELGRCVTLVLGCEEALPIPEVKNVNVIRVISKYHFLVAPQMAKVVKKYYTNGSAILVYGSPLLCLFLSSKKFNIYFECTEVPMYGKSKGWGLRLKESYKLSLAKRATGMFVISNALKAYFIQRGIKNISVINMFVDASRFDIDVPQNNGKYIAYCGTISPFKDGVDCLIEAFRMFRESHMDYSLKIIGRFESEKSEQEVRELVESLGLNTAIDFTGLVSAEEMPKLLKGASMLALARPNNVQAQYGFPTKLGEYLVSGKPVVVTRVGEIGDFLTDGVNCRMAEPDNPQDFADKMVWVAENKEKALLLGEKGKQLTNKVFSSHEQCKKAIEFMDKSMGCCH